jgi:hypothetical protein
VVKAAVKEHQVVAAEIKTRKPTGSIRLVIDNPVAVTGLRGQSARLSDRRRARVDPLDPLDEPLPHHPSLELTRAASHRDRSPHRPAELGDHPFEEPSDEQPLRITGQQTVDRCSDLRHGEPVAHLGLGLEIAQIPILGRSLDVGLRLGGGRSSGPATRG